MKRILFVSTAITTVASVASVAFAGNLDTPAVIDVVPAAASAGVDWSGFYLGATYGIGLGGDMEYDTEGDLILYDDLEPGASYGAFAGYNVQRNNLVFGAEVAYSAVDTPGFGPIGYTDETFNYFVDGKARVGYAMNKVLVYGFAGYTLSEFSFGGGDGHKVDGMNYGAGVDVMFGEHMFAGAEYIARNVSGELDGGPQIQTTNIQALQLRAGWKF